MINNGQRQPMVARIDICFLENVAVISLEIRQTRYKHVLTLFKTLH